ncbi:hypothetical protein FJV76_17140 [Mesorhizobium sp. WSM4303]|uniref:hypothetical protein n=1 Tax=unclassified Mesorhizobium TaxID=325217 RepID=UPI00115DC88D|nr:MULTISPECIES: hypothetical protein [unclassified Mesorhizobium]TRC99654.1 hypothetical protein FJV77_04315 [Mesorhizobium sp. WSM4306]TRD03262.1 hypothetical protein FJV76_17140 [Mesorhizobium sp. WSM4303]
MISINRPAGIALIEMDLCSCKVFHNALGDEAMLAGKARLRLHAGPILSFLAAGAAGVIMYVLMGAYLLFCCAAVLSAISLSEGWRAARIT